MDRRIVGLSGVDAHDGDVPEIASSVDGHESIGGGAGFGEEILPRHDSQSSCGGPTLSPPPPSHVTLHSGGAWGSMDSEPSSSDFRNYDSVEVQKSSKFIPENSNIYDYTTTNMVEIDQIVKKYADILLHTLEGVNSRLSQLEGKSYNLGTDVDNLKLSINKSGGSRDEKLRQLENVLREVQTGIQFIHDKQEIAKAQMQLSTLQVSEGDNQPLDNSMAAPSASVLPSMPLLHPHLQQSSQHSTALTPLQLSATPLPNDPVPPPQPNSTPVQFLAQVPKSHASNFSSIPPREPFVPPPSQQPAEAPPQQHQPPSQQIQLPPYQPFHQSVPQNTQYLQPAHPPTQALSPRHIQHSAPHHPQEPPHYMPSSQAYPPSTHQPPHIQSGPPPHIYGSSTNVYENVGSRSYSVQPHLPTGYGPPLSSNFSDSHTYSGPSYSSTREPSHFPAPSNGSTHPCLPISQTLPQAHQIESNSGNKPGNTVALDAVVDKVITMGFPRDLVRATVGKLMEDGQNVDLNVVLDKLMNGSGVQQLKGYPGR